MNPGLVGKFGIIRGKLDEPYTNIGLALTGDPYSIVGVYYTDSYQSGGSNVILFRTFDGSSVNYFNNDITLERLATHRLVDELACSDFDLEAWRVEGFTDPLYERFQRTIVRSLASTPIGSNRDYRKLLLSIANLSSDRIINGYYRINQIILSTCDIDPEGQKYDLYGSLIETKFLKPFYELNREYKDRYTEPSIEDTIRESKRYISILSDSFVSLISDDPLFRSYIHQLGPSETTLSSIRGEIIKSSCPDINQNKGEVSDPDGDKDEQPFVEKITLERRELETPLSRLREIIDRLKGGFTTSNLPVISVPDLIEIHNLLADRTGITRIEEIAAIQHRSIGVIALAGKSGFYIDNAEIELKSGDTIVLPTKGADLSEFTDEQLLEIHRYIYSLASSDGRFNHILNKIIETLSSRNRSRRK